MQKIIYVISIFALVLPSAVFAAGSLSAVTKPVVQLTYNSAQISADVTASDTPDNVYWFEWGVSGSEEGTVFKTPELSVGSRYTRTGTYMLRGLAPSTQYFYRVVAENQVDHVAGKTIYFTTKSYDTPAEAIVIAQTRGITSLRDTGAIMHGYVAPHNGTARYWFEYGDDNKVTETSADHAANREGGEVTTELHGLLPGSTYYYRIAAENERGIVRGEVKSFKTTGVKPTEEAKKNQTAGKTDTTRAGSTGATSGLFGSLGNSSNKDTPAKDTAASAKISGSDLSGSVGSSVKDVAISVKALGKAGAHETIEYKVAYVYNRAESAKKAEFQVTLPSTLVYVGDTTANELRVKNVTGGARMYVLPIGAIAQGDTRTFSIIAMTTADAKGIPAVKADLVFTTKNNEQMVAGVAAAKTGSLFGGSSNGSASSGTFPTTMILWLIVLNVAIASVLGMIRAKEWYRATQARLKEAEEKAKAAALSIKADLEGKHAAPVMVVVPQTQPESPVIHQFEQELDSVKGEEVEEFGLPGAYTVSV